MTYSFDSLGIRFVYQNCTTWWRWPWKRKAYSDGSGAKRYIVHMGGWAEFNTLAEIDQFWKEYFDELIAKENS